MSRPFYELAGITRNGSAEKAHKWSKTYTVWLIPRSRIYIARASDNIPAMRATAAIPVAQRVSGFVYAIRNIVAEARKVEASGRTVRYLNIGDPITFGFKTPPHMIE